MVVVGVGAAAALSFFLRSFVCSPNCCSGLSFKVVFFHVLSNAISLALLLPEQHVIDLNLMRCLMTYSMIFKIRHDD